LICAFAALIFNRGVSREQTFEFDQFISTPNSIVPLRIVRNPRARRYLLRLNSDHSAQLTIPRGGSILEAKAFLNGNIAWLERASTRLATRPRLPLEWKVGTSIYWRGELVLIDLRPERGEHVISFGPEFLIVRNAAADLRREVECYVWRLASDELPTRVRALAQTHSIGVNSVSVRNQRSRWGSCSNRGTISLNWRLLQTPAFVSDYLIIHELMHRREMNHSDRFWEHVAAACPGYRVAEKWLNQHSHLLR
jgi:predicted metal-dependent hydrolase